MLVLPDLIQRCRARGVKLTPQRLAIFECVLGLPGHPSAEEIFQEVQRRHPTLSFATVYNTLQLLKELGQVHEVIVDELRRRYDLNTEPHHHAVCRRCHRIIDIPARATGASWDQLAAADLGAYQFRVDSARIEFSGLCGGCQGAVES